MIAPLVVIPAYNEARSVAAIVAALRDLYPYDVTVVDDASTDGTAEAARRSGAHVIRLPVKLGAWGATQTGIRYALWKDYQRLVAMDADGQHLAETVAQLTQFADAEQADLVVGSCVSRATAARRLAWRIFRHLGRFHFQDLSSGLRLYSRSAMELAVGKGAALLDYQDVGVLALFRNNQLNIREVEVPMQRRVDGASRVFSSWARVAHYCAQTALLSTAKVSFSPRKQGMRR